MTITIAGMTFDTIADAAEALSTTADIIVSLCNSRAHVDCYIGSPIQIEKPVHTNSIGSTQQILNIRKTEGKRRKRYGRRVIIRGTEYRSIEEASKYIDAHPNEIMKRCNAEDRPDYQWVEESNKERFYKDVDIRGPDECWEWKGTYNQMGYGQCGMFGVAQAYRVAWILNFGPIPEGAHVRHAVCANRKCVNHHHLSLGTARENMYDKDRFLLLPFPAEESVVFPSGIKNHSRDWIFVGSTKRERVIRACNKIMHN